MATQDFDEIYTASMQHDQPSPNSHSSPPKVSSDSKRPPRPPHMRQDPPSLEDDALCSSLIPTLYAESAYHGIIRKTTAEKILTKQSRPSGSYLIYMDKGEINRVSICILYHSKRLKGSHVLEGVLSFPRHTPSVKLDCTDDIFASIRNLIEYYTDNPIPVDRLSSSIEFATSQYSVKLAKGVERDIELIRKLSPLDHLMELNITDEELMEQCYKDDTLPYFTSEMTQAVRIRRYSRENLLDPCLPITVPRLIQSFVKECKDKIVIKWKQRDVWESITYLELFDMALQVAKALKRCGLNPGRAVGLFGGNSPHWIISNLGIIMAGGVSVAISPSSKEERLKQIVVKTRLQFIFVGDLEFFTCVHNIIDDVGIEHVILFPPHVVPADLRGVDWATFNSRGCGQDNDEIVTLMRGLKPNKCCTVLFSSGTTNAPKGVMLSHDNITRHLSDSIQFFEMKKYTSKNNRTLCFYPLSVILAHLNDIYINIMMKGTLYIIHPTPWLKNDYLNYCLKEVRPTNVIAGENFWVNVYRQLSKKVEESGYFKQKFTMWAESLTEKQVTQESNNLKHKLLFSVVRTLFIEHIAKELGLDECKICCSTYAPLSREVFEFLIKRNILVINIYGMTEATATVASTRSRDTRLIDASIMSEIDYEIIDEADDGIGEICISGRNIFVGYVGEEQLTQDAFTVNQLTEIPYYKTGDLGRLKDNLLTYHGRKIHHIRMGDGERVFPVLLEEKLLERLPFVEYAVVLPLESGKLIALITVKVKLNENGDRTKELDSFAAHSCLHHLRINCVPDINEFMSNIQVREFITREVKQINKEAVSKNHYIKTWAFAKEGFSIRTGELTQSMKLKREEIFNRFIKGKPL